MSDRTETTKRVRIYNRDAGREVTDLEREAIIAELEREMDRGHASALIGPHIPVSVILADIDAVLAEIAKEEKA